MPELGTAHGRVKLDKGVAGPDALTVADVDRTHHSGLKRLDRFGSAGRNDLARRHGDNVDRADARPGERNAEHGDNGESDGAADRRRGSLDDLECGRQKREFVLATLFTILRKLDNVPSGLHGAPAPAPAGPFSCSSGHGPGGLRPGAPAPAPAGPLFLLLWTRPRRASSWSPCACSGGALFLLLWTRPRRASSWSR